jgi:hypothetical protein
MIAYTPASLPPSPAAAVVRTVAVNDDLNFETARTLVQTAKAAAEEIVKQGTRDPIVDTWRLLPKPTDAEMAPIVAHVPDLKLDLVRRVDWEYCQLLIEDAVKNRNTLLDFITSPALRGPIIFYVPAPALQKAYATYSGLFLTKPFGKDLDKNDFFMHGLLIGNGRIDVIYNRDDISYRDEGMNLNFTVKRRMSVSIVNPGEVSIAGLSTSAFFMTPIIQRIVKTGE